MNGSDIIMIKVMCEDSEEALEISKSLLEKRLIACANIIGPAKSVFRWKGKIETGDEAVLLMKSQNKLLADIVEEVGRLHSYELPEVSAFKITGGCEDYMAWVAGETQGAGTAD